MTDISIGDLIWYKDYNCCCIVIDQNELAYFVAWQNCKRLALENMNHWIFKQSLNHKNKYKIYKCDTTN